MPSDLADQIAAGEVVERPASAVKELVENAIDAGARHVKVELAEGGLELIRVSDDGAGMGREDAQLCIQRHATSKLHDRRQLFSIETLGFRGEALPSIASVSRFTLLTKPHGALGGTRVALEGGRNLEVTDAGAPPGTEVTIRDLFYNTPARLKFLKTRATELKHVVEWMQRMAVANAGVAFTLIHNGRRILDLPAVEDVSDRLFNVFGAKDSEALHPLEPAHQDGVTCTGFFGRPTLSRSTTSGMWAFVNGRFVRDKTVMGAIRVAYQGMVDKGRHPVVVLFLDVPPSAVDVNVHPAKTEVRFHESSAVFRAVRRSIANSLSVAPWVPSRDGDGAGVAPWVGEAGADGATATGYVAPHAQSALPVREYALHGPNWTGPSDGEALQRGGGVGEAGFRARDPGGRYPYAGGTAWSDGQGGDIGALPSRPDAGFFESLAYIGHLRGTFLLASDGDGLVVVDQHAAHERITFEALRLSWRDRRYQQQPLLVPRVLTLDPIRAAIMADNMEIFQRLGFEIEPFGGDDFALKAAPVVLKSKKHERLIVDVLDEIGEHGHSGQVDEAIDAVLLSMACHGSIRAGDTLTVDEVYALYRALDGVDFGANCPHGRPVYFRMSLEELETRFGRR